MSVRLVDARARRFTPLTGCEVRGLHVEGALLVAEVGLTVNLGSATLERVMGWRSTLLSSMGDSMVQEVLSALCGTGVEIDVSDALRAQLHAAEGVLAHEPLWYNDDEHFMRAVTAVVDAKNGALCRGHRRAGLGAAQMLGRGFSAAQCREAGYSARELREAGMHPMRIAALGYSLVQLREAGCEDSDLLHLSVEELREGDYALAALYEAGRPAADLVAAGFGFTALYEAGYAPMELRGLGATVRDMHTARVPVLSVRAAGYPVSEMLATHLYSPLQMVTQGCCSKAEVATTPFIANTLQMVQETPRPLADMRFKAELDRQKQNVARRRGDDVRPES